ncbi:FAD-dependent oxidoreductase [Candidatus Giovannonibacteria bacterium]|nr:FAD-dependent oxidoreductase [Candidatus Giovannonibacteria bacterium]
MAKYKFTLKERRDVAEGTMAFVFDTSGAPDFSFRAGQYVEVGLENPPYTDEKKNHREFSITSSPEEKGIIMIASRMRDSAFKRSMREVPMGTEFAIEGPYGDFSLHENIQRQAVFIAGGIGITPVRSILKDAAERKLPHKIILIYSNRTPESAAFMEDLEKFEKMNPNLTVLATMTDMENAKNPWEGLRGRVDADFIKNNIGDLSNSTYYIVGPAQMVSGVGAALESAGVSRDDMRFEEFSGY